ncbi:glycoside hydrolase family 2 protein [Galbibacter mesophilus]|uniref:glycoside hydrolase family 2 protein n=1 Tax=Galbibacter mesophilus TaxID=379069 RepID=UPI00191DE387|nr:glycoside hydrolase family 2 TIM barrel-domain containing protein [Galbibacter mesophilus]MCM5664040.1 hypothetical protein [Galbibacter mesophilus]
MVQLKKNNITLIKSIFLLLFFTSFNSYSQERIYLSGKDSDDAVLWDFKCSTGRNSGYWTTIPVPSNWETKGFGNYTYFKDDKGYKTNPDIGYYKHTFTLPTISKKHFRLVFQGAMTDTQVKINGKLAGKEHQGGFTQFSYNISNLVQEGENTIEVKVSKQSKNASVQRAERFADFWLFGGIFRPVYIDILPTTHIKRMALDAKMDGSLKVDAFLENVSENQTILAQVYTSKGVPIGKPFSETVKQNSVKIRLESKIQEVQPWSHEIPNLYTLKMTLKQGKVTVHSLNQRFGFRTFEVRDHDGFYLNGKRILLKGASMHSFRPGKGRSLSRKDNLADLKLMKDLNFNTVRTPCYPPDEYFLDLCDSLGLLVLNELPGWSKPLNTEIGSKLVKELVVRDVNHPSILMWGNGNHKAHNAELEDAFLKWDIQQRRPYKNAAKTEAWPGKNPGRFPLINTQYYPTYEELIQRLNGNQIVMPNETLHGLYDGGAGAGLEDYWNAIEKSKIGGGLIIWALYDEGLIRTDQGYRIDNQLNKAPDGIVGPNQEKKGSYNAVKEIWSPVQVVSKNFSKNFDGRIEVENKFTFTNLNQCTFRWKYIQFTSPIEASSGYHTLKQGELKGPNIMPEAKGNLKIPTFLNNLNADAIELTAFDPYGQSLWTWRMVDENNLGFMKKFLPQGNFLPVNQDTSNPYLFYSGNTVFHFDKNKPGLQSIQTDSIKMPISGIPRIVAKTASGRYNASEKRETKVTFQKKKNEYIIRYKNTNGFEYVEWTIMAKGVLKMDYQYKIPKGEYYFAGIGFHLSADKVLNKRWLGEGPYRVYKNRRKGTTMNVWQVNKQENVPGEIYNFPEFEGYFGKWHWAQLNLSNHKTIGLATLENLYLGLLKPNAGKDPKNAAIFYPDQSGIYFFNYISPIGEKWKIPQDIGPAAQLNEINKPLSGTVYFNFYGGIGSEIKFENIEIE